MNKALLYTCLAVFLVQLDATILYIAFSSIAGSFPEVSAGGLSWVLNIYTLTFGALLIPAGTLGDRLGRKKVFLIGVTVFTLASLLCGLSGSVEQLIAFRFLQAAGAAMLVPTSLALLLEDTPREKRSVAVSLWGASGALSAAIGPALGGILVASLGWHWAFFINVPIGIFVVLAGRANLPASIAQVNKRLPSPLSILLVIAAMGSLCYALLAEGTQSSNSGRTLFFLAGVGLMILFLLHCRFSKRGLMDLSLFKIPTFSIANSGTLIYSIAFSVIFFGSVQNLIYGWHHSVMAAGLLLVPGPLFVIPAAILSGRYARNYGHRMLLVVGSLLVCVGLAYQITPLFASPTLLLSWMPGWLLIGIGHGMVFPGLSAAATLDLPADRYSMGSGVNNSIRQFGSLLGIAVAILILGKGDHATTADFATLFKYAIALVFVVAILSLGINTHIRRTV